MKLKNKKILITAGPTWVPIDKVRVISNIATGKTGILLAKKTNKLGAKVTLLIGPVGEISLAGSIKVKRFYYFAQLDKILKKELKTKKYDIVIHSAAVSDYQPKKKFVGKIKSHKNLFIDLETTVKIVDKIKKYAPGVFLIIFKLELNVSYEKLLQQTRKTIQQANADLAVANTFKGKIYKAFIMDKNKLLKVSNSKKELTEKLVKIISI